MYKDQRSNLPTRLHTCINDEQAISAGSKAQPSNLLNTLTLTDSNYHSLNNIAFWESPFLNLARAGGGYIFLFYMHYMCCTRPFRTSMCRYITSTLTCHPPYAFCTGPNCRLMHHFGMSEMLSKPHKTQPACAKHRVDAPAQGEQVNV